MSDGSLNQDEIDALLNGADDVGMQNKKNEIETLNEIPDLEDDSIYLTAIFSQIGTALSGYFSGCEVTIEIIQVSPYSERNIDLVNNGKMVISAINSGPANMALFIDYLTSRKIAEIMMGNYFIENLNVEDELNDAEKSVLDVFFSQFNETISPMLHDKLSDDDGGDIQNFYDIDAGSIIDSAEWNYFAELKFKVIKTGDESPLIDSPVYLLITEDMMRLLVEYIAGSISGQAKPVHFSGLNDTTAGCVRNETLKESFRGKLKAYAGEKGKKSLKKRNLIHFYNETLTRDEKRYIAGEDYGVSSTRSGMKKILNKIRDYLAEISREENVSSFCCGYGADIENFKFPVTLRVDDMIVGIDDINRADINIAPLIEFAGRTGSIMTGDVEIATVQIVKERFGNLSLEVIETSMDGKDKDNFSLTDKLLTYNFNISVEVGRMQMPADKAKRIGNGSIISFERTVYEPLDVYLDDYDVIIAKCEAVVVDENFGVRLTDIINPDYPAVLSGKRKKQEEIGSDPVVPVRCILGRTRLILNNLLALGEGSVIELDTTPFMQVEVLVGNDLRIDGEIIVIDGKFGVRVVDNEIEYDSGISLDSTPGDNPDDSTGVSLNRGDEKHNLKYSRLSVKELKEKTAESIRRNTGCAVPVFMELISKNPAEAACFAIALGSDDSSLLLADLPEEMVITLSKAAASIENVDAETGRAALFRFIEKFDKLESSFKGGDEFTNDLLEKSFSKEKASEIKNSLNTGESISPLGFLDGVNITHLGNFLLGEHPQTIALVLSYLSPGSAAFIISSLPHAIQGDVAERIVCMGNVSTSVVKDIARILERKISMIGSTEYSRSGGIDSLVEMLNRSDRGTEKTIIETFEAANPELAEEIKKRMVVFEDMVFLDDRSIQKVLREVDTQDLAKALKGASCEVQEKIYRNMSKRASVLLKEDIGFIGPVLLAYVQESQQRIVNIIRKLEDSGDIVIVRSGEEGFFI